MSSLEDGVQLIDVPGGVPSNQAASITLSSPLTSRIHTSSIWPGPWEWRDGPLLVGYPPPAQLPNMPPSQSAPNTASSGTWKAIDFPAYPSTVMSTGAEASRDA